MKVKKILIAVVFIVIFLLLQNTLTANSPDSNFTINLHTDKNDYNKGERIHINGNITSNTSNNISFSNNVTIKLKKNNWERTFKTKITNNSYDSYYNISYGDPEGIWNITVETYENGNNISNYKTINVTLPSDTVRYKVVWYSPPESAQYKRGETFNASIFVTEDGVGVTNLTTNCVLPNLDKINLSEIKQGYYRGSYKIPWNCKTGIWVLTFEGTKNVEGSLRAGGGNSSITIKPAIINIDLLEPSLDQYYLNDKIEIKVKLTYKDNTNVKNAEVTAEILNENYSLKEGNNDTYSTNYTILDENTGSILIEISTQDQNDNTGSIKKVISIVKKQETESIIITILPIIIAILIITIVTYFLSKRLKFLRMQDVQEEIKEVKRLQDEAAEKYYKKGSISRQSYDMLRKEHSERLAELQGGGKKKVAGKNIISKLRWEKNE